MSAGARRRDLQPGKRAEVIRSGHPAEGQRVVILERSERNGACAFQYVDGSGHVERAVLDFGDFAEQVLDGRGGSMVRRG